MQFFLSLYYQSGPLFYTIFLPISTVHVQIQIYGADTCPISSSPKSLGVVVKAEKQGSVSWRTLNELAVVFSQIFPCLSLSFSLILIPFHGVFRCVTFRWLTVPFVLDLAYSRRSSSLDWSPGPTFTLVWASRFVTPTPNLLEMIIQTKMECHHDT